MFEKFSLSSPGMCHLSGSVHSPLLLSSSFLCLLFSTAPFFFSLPCSFLYSDSSVLQTCYSIISFLHLFPFPMITWHAPSLWSTAPLIYYTVHFRPPVLQPPSMCHLSVPPSHPPRGLPQLEAQNETAIVFHVFHSLAIVLITVSCSFSSLAVLPALLPALSFPAPFIDIPARFMCLHCLSWLFSADHDSPCFLYPPSHVPSLCSTAPMDFPVISPPMCHLYVPLLTGFLMGLHPVCHLLVTVPFIYPSYTHRRSCR